MPDKVGTLQNSCSGFLKHMNVMNAECNFFDNFWMNISKSLWIKKNKIVDKESDKEHHFVGSRFVAIPFCRVERRSQNHFEDKRSSTPQNGPP